MESYGMLLGSSILLTFFDVCAFRSAPARLAADRAARGATGAPTIRIGPSPPSPAFYGRATIIPPCGWGPSRMARGASSPSPRLPSGRSRPSATGYGEGRGEELFHKLRLAARPPHPARESAPTCPRKRGEVSRVWHYKGIASNVSICRLSRTTVFSAKRAPSGPSRTTRSS
jgi:hypothetical protein